jgi:hypothetical protein
MRFYALAQRPWIEEDGGGYWGLPPGTIGSVDLSAVGARNRVFVTSDLPYVVAGDILATFGSGARLDQHALSGRERNNWNSLLGVSIPNGTILLDALWNILTVQADPDGLTRAKPIMPTHRGVLELHLGGHSLVRSEQLPEDPTLHPAWPVMQRVFRNDYRAIQSRDETLARKWLGAQRLKLRVSEERVSELLIDDDLERVAPLRPTTTILDDFNRADSTGLGANWITPHGRWDVVSNQAKSTGTNANDDARHETELSSADMYVQVAANVPVGTSQNRVCSRHNGGGPTTRAWYLGLIHGNGTMQLWRLVSGSTFTKIGVDVSVTWANGDILRIESDGSSHRVLRNGVEVVVPVTDTNITGPAFAGISSNSANNIVDDFEAADLLAGGDDLVLVVAEAMGADEQRSRLLAITRQRSDDVGVGHASLRARSRSRLLAEANGIGEATVSVVEAIGAELLRVVSEAVAATEAVARALGLTRRRHEALGTVEAAVRLRALARRRSDMSALAETVRSAREMVRLRSEAASVSETTVTAIDAIIAAVVRVVSEVIGMAEMAGRPRHRARSRGETVGLATAVVLVGVVLGAVPAAIADRARMVVRAARRLIDRAAIRFNVPPAKR